MLAVTKFPSDSTGPLRIAVLAGGTSAEREISLQSGDAVSRVLSARGHRVIPIDPAEVDLPSWQWNAVDVAFVALHGRFGEDGEVQALLENLRVPYTGSNAAVSRMAFSKSASKERFLQHRVATPAYVLVHQADDAARIRQLAQSISFPLVVKPDTQGSSLGVSIVRSFDELPQALARCFHFDSFGIIEAAVAGTEWTVGFLDDLALPVIQIETDREFFDFDAKYHDDETRYRLDFLTPGSVVQAIEDLGRKACQALGTRGLVRVDIRLDRLDRPWVLEVNTIPGLTGHSLIPKAAARAGLDLGQLCEQAVRNCLQNRRSAFHSP